MAGGFWGWPLPAEDRRKLDALLRGEAPKPGQPDWWVDDRYAAEQNLAAAAALGHRA
jgi:hypothetical protein